MCGEGGARGGGWGGRAGGMASREILDCVCGGGRRFEDPGGRRGATVDENRVGNEELWVRSGDQSSSQVAADHHLNASVNTRGCRSFNEI